MSTFRTWLEQQVEIDNMHLAPQNERQVKEIWDQIFKRLIGQQSRTDAISKSLDDLTHSRKPGKSSSQAILDTVGPLLQQLGKLHPNYAQRVQDAMSWLGEERPDGAPNRNLEDLMERLFGDKYEVFLGKEGDGSDMGEEQGKLKKAPPQPPLDSGSGMEPTEPDQSQPDPNDPNSGMMPQQPQVPSPNPMMRPTNPMPPIPPNAARMGLY